MWMMLQQDEPSDYVLATGEVHSVREFVEMAFARVGIAIAWRGEGVDEVGYDTKTGTEIVLIDPIYFRATEVDFLCGDSTKARERLGWSHSISFAQMVEEMVDHEVQAVQDDLKSHSGRVKVREA